MGETQEMLTRINKVQDMDNMTDLEKKHHPVITAPEKVKAGECFEVTIEVGKLLEHPNQPAHFIEFVELYAGDVYLSRLALTAQMSCPTMKVCVSLPKDMGDLRAFTLCNLHGIWESRKPITVE